MKNKLIFKIIISIFLSCTQIFAEEDYIVSFNALRLGDSKQKDYKKMAEVLKDYKIVGLAEVMNREGIEILADELSEISGERWEYNISPHGVGSKNYKEFYGFVWKRDEVEFIKEMGFYPDEEDKFIREPYGAMFKIDKFDFIFVMSHSIFGDKKSQRQVEAMNYNLVYEYFQDLEKDEQDVIIAGDFNLPASDLAFTNFLQNKDEIIHGVDPKIKTTIGSKGFASSYDNMFLSKKYTTEFTGENGVNDFTNGEYLQSRKIISDHLPIYIVVETGKDDD